MSHRLYNNLNFSAAYFPGASQVLSLVVTTVSGSIRYDDRQTDTYIINSDCFGVTEEKRA